MSLIRTPAIPSEQQDAGTSLSVEDLAVRVRLASMWTAMLFLFAYVDIFGLFRPDVRAELDAGRMAGFDVGEAFLLGVTGYITPACLMVAATVVARPALARTANLVLAPLYALTIVGGAVGEWWYYVVGSALEAALLVGITVTAWRWGRSPTV